MGSPCLWQTMDIENQRAELFSKGAYAACSNGKAMAWDVQTLWELSAGLPVKKVGMDSFPNFDKPCWFQNGEATVRNISIHAKRIFETDLNYPVILSSQGELMDGMHRIAKAWIIGWTEIPAVQFETDPPPDRVWPIPEDGDVRKLIEQDRIKDHNQ